jgi:hypothetical protein
VGEKYRGVRRRRGVYRVLERRPQGKRHLENLVVNGRIILEMGWEDMDCMDLDQNRDSLKVFMHGIVTFRFQ